MEARSQYHHFIPRFVLRDFAAEDPAATGADGTGGNPVPQKPNKKKKRKSKKKKQTKAASNTVDGPLVGVTEKLDGITLAESGSSTAAGEGPAPKLDRNEGGGQEVAEPSTARPRQIAATLPGNPRMQSFVEDPKNPLIKFYDLDTGILEHRRIARAYGNQDMYRDLNAADANHIEKQLAVLEQSASRVVRRIKDAQKSEAKTVDLTRVEINNLRKFLFVMKYRSNLFWTKYNGPLEEYKAVDKTAVQAFMKTHGFKKLAEVWLHTLKVILHTPIDVGGEWQQVVLTKAFSHDAQWYIFHMSESYLSLCQPDNPDDEFIITENGFGIHEGPSFYTFETDPSTGSPATKGSYYTEYHKMASLSPKLLLVLRSNSLRKGNEAILGFIRSRPEVSKAPSLFEDLELAPAVPSYGVEAVQSLKRRDDHTFSFTIHKIPVKYTDLFNAVMLEEARASITWSSDTAMLRSLKEYLSHPKFPANPIFCEELKREAKVRLVGILDGSLTDLPPLPQMGVVEIVENAIASKSELAAYFKLGGTPSTYFFDVQRAKEISQKRMQSADRLPRGPRNLSARNASSRKSLLSISKKPNPVVYLHIKQWRVNANVAKKRGEGIATSMENEASALIDTGPEDLVGNLARLIPEKHRSLMMLEASMKVFFRGVNRDRANNTWAGLDQMDGIMLQSENDLFAQWGGISTSCFLENTQFYSDIGKKIMDPRRSTGIETKMFENFVSELQLRSELKASGFIEQRFLGADSSQQERIWLQELLWETLYWWPTPENLARSALSDEDAPGCIVS